MTVQVNYDDAVRQIESAGIFLDPKHPLRFDAKIQRWKVLGEDKEKRGWTRLKEWVSGSGATYLVGNFGVWHGNDDNGQRIEMPRRDDDKPLLSAEEIASIRAAQKEAARRLEAERKAEAQVAARWAASVWHQCAPADEHDYLARKQIKAHGLRVLGTVSGEAMHGVDESNWWRIGQAAGALVVPMHDPKGAVCGLQFIYPKGHPRRAKLERDKEFWPSGMAMGGTFGLIGYLRRSGVLLIAEGYATAASLAEATGQSVAYAFSANNLIKAARQIRKAYPSLKLLAKS